jgi:hypothetical protein
LRPLGALTVGADVTLGLFAEVSGLATAADGRTRYRVEVTRLRAERSSLPAEIVSWLGRRLGIGGRTAEPRAAWVAQGDPALPAAIALDVGTEDAATGLYVFELIVTDLVSGASAQAKRVVRIR